MSFYNFYYGLKLQNYNFYQLSGYFAKMNCPANKDDHEERHLHLKTHGTWGLHVGHGDTWDTGEKGDTEIPAEAV